DFNRDGLVDFSYVANVPSQAPVTRVELGNGTRFAPGAGQDCTYGFNGSLWSNKQFLFATADGASGILDVDGDGYLDDIFTSGYALGYSWGNYPIGVRLGGPNGFTDTPLWWSLDLTHSWSFVADPFGAGVLPFFARDQQWTTPSGDIDLPGPNVTVVW